jgi:hypothetical protein
MKLYAIPAEIEEIFSFIDQVLADESLPENEKAGKLATLKDQLNLVQMERRQKCLWLSRQFLNLQAERLAVNEQRQKFSERVARLDKQTESIKNFLGVILDAGEKMADEVTQISWRKSEGVILRCDPESLPARFTRVKVEASLTSLKEALKAGDREAAQVAVLEQRQTIAIK